jgi:hypothetical protein
MDLSENNKMDAQNEIGENSPVTFSTHFANVKQKIQDATKNLDRAVVAKCVGYAMLFFLLCYVIGKLKKTPQRINNAQSVSVARRFKSI